MQEYEHIQITEDVLLSHRIRTQQIVVSERLVAIYPNRTQNREPNLAEATAMGFLSLTMLKSTGLSPSESFTHGWLCGITDWSPGNTGSLHYADTPNEGTLRSTFSQAKIPIHSTTTVSLEESKVWEAGKLTAADTGSPKL